LSVSKREAAVETGADVPAAVDRAARVASNTVASSEAAEEGVVPPEAIAGLGPAVPSALAASSDHKLKRT
jgi:hypothetical protein